MHTNVPRSGRRSRAVAFLRRHRWLVAGIGVGFTCLLVFALAYFQPQQLFIDNTVNDPLPGVVAEASVGAATPAAPGASAAPITVVSTGTLHSGEHHTTGTVRVLRLRD